MTDSAGGAATAPTSAIVADDAPWVVFESEWGRTESKLLRASMAENSYTILIRWTAGTHVPPHRHFGSVHAWTIAGRWGYTEYDWVAGPGTYVFEPPGTVHSLRVYEDTEALFVVNGGQVDFGPSGEILYCIDAPTALAVYEAGLRAMGLELPEGLVTDRSGADGAAAPPVDLEQYVRTDDSAGVGTSDGS